MDDVGEPAFEAAHGFHRGLAGGLSPVEVGAAFGLVANLDDGQTSLGLAEVAGEGPDFAGEEGLGIRDIAHRLSRCPSTISRELRRNASTRTYQLDYKASIAQWHTEWRERRPRRAKLAENDRLRQYVQDRLYGVIRAADGTVVGAEGAVVVKLGGNGKTVLTNNSGGTVQLVADVAGYDLAG